MNENRICYVVLMRWEPSAGRFVTHMSNVIHQKECTIKLHYVSLGRKLLLCVGKASVVITNA